MMRTCTVIDRSDEVAYASQEKEIVYRQQLTSFSELS